MPTNKNAGATRLIYEWQQKNPRAKVKADSKDRKRVEDLLRRAGSESAAMNKARQMAGSIKDVAKALRRADAAASLGLHEIEAVFQEKAAGIIAGIKKSARRVALRYAAQAR